MYLNDTSYIRLHKNPRRTIFIAEGVWDELNAENQRWPGSEEVAAADWVHRKRIKNFPLVNALRQDLDRGEAETIALAIEINADLVLLDEREGRALFSSAAQLKNSRYCWHFA